VHIYAVNVSPVTIAGRNQKPDARVVSGLLHAVRALEQQEVHPGLRCMDAASGESTCAPIHLFSFWQLPVLLQLGKSTCFDWFDCSYWTGT